ncbi:MAG: ABC transporter permease [Candidatus Zixiibacteriota bacterium]
MNVLVAMAVKDLRLLGRDKFALFWVLVFPLLMALFFGAIFSSEGRSISRLRIAAVDEAGTEQAERLIRQLEKSSALSVRRMPKDSARALVGAGRLVAYVAVGPGENRARNMGPWEPPGIEIGIDPARKAEAGYLQGLVTEAYFTQLQAVTTDPAQSRDWIRGSLAVLDSAREMPGEKRQVLKDLLTALDNYGTVFDSASRAQSSPFAKLNIAMTEITARAKHPRSSFEITFPQAMLWGLLGVTLAFAHSIVGERTGGTWLRLRVAPISRGQILAGKALASLIACVTISVFLILVGRAIFGVRLTNPLGVVVAILSCALCFSGLVMMISVLGKTQQAVAGAGWGIMLIMAMIGGGMVPLMVMPSWMLVLSNISPVKWGIYGLEGAIWRGFTLSQMMFPAGILVIVGAVAFTIGVVILSRSDG